ncbi:hypothetical protein ACFLZ2_02070 [Candidatus Margulisiibacteriota bacterium]
MGQGIVLTGPFMSAGKRSLGVAVRSLNPDLASRMTTVPLNTISVRNWDRSKIQNVVTAKGWSRQNFVSCYTKRKMLVLNLDKVKEAVERPDSIVYLDLPVDLAVQLINNSYLGGINLTSVFLSPMTKTELLQCRPDKSEPKYIATWRHQIASYLKERFRVGIELEGWREISKTQWFLKRGRFTTLSALMSAPRFDHILPVYDADNSPNWDPGNISGSAARTVISLTSILRGEKPVSSEDWPIDMFKQPV